MTHEELLAKIDLCFQDIPVDYGQADAHKALRAVVELHKPNEFNDCCNGCDSDLPCPTIQAIEKELA